MYEGLAILHEIVSGHATKDLEIYICLSPSKFTLSRPEFHQSLATRHGSIKLGRARARAREGASDPERGREGEELTSNSSGIFARDPHY